MFCVYAVVAVIFTYFYQLTFFAAFMVYTCRREAEGRHCLTFRQMSPAPAYFQRNLPSKHILNIEMVFEDFSQLPPPRYSPTPASKFKTLNNFHTKDKISQQNSLISRFFRTTYADFLLNSFVQKAVLVIFVAYLVVAAYGCKNVKLGMEPKNLLPDNSYGKRALNITERYFSDYGSYLHIWMYNLSTVNVGHRRLWIVLNKEIELYVSMLIRPSRHMFRNTLNTPVSELYLYPSIQLVCRH